MINLTALPLKVIYKSFSTTISNYSKNNKASSQARIMSKLFYGSKKKKIWYDNPSPMQKNGNLPVLPSSKRISGEKRREIVLNKLFMHHISDYLSSGEISQEIYGLGVQISNIKITPDYKHMNIYWHATESHIEKVENIFMSYKNKLRHELSQLCLIGHVPKLEFIKDKDLLKFKELENFLLKLNEQVQEEPEKEEMIVKKELPQMTSKVFNLDHEKIMDRVKRCMNKSKALHRTQPEIGMIEDLLNNKKTEGEENYPVYSSDHIKKFLQKKAIMKKKEKNRRHKDEVYLEQNIEDSLYEELADGFTDTFK